MSFWGYWDPDPPGILHPDIEMQPDASGVWCPVNRSIYDVFFIDAEGNTHYTGKGFVDFDAILQAFQSGKERVVMGVDYGTYEYYNDSDGRVIACDPERSIHINCDHDTKERK